MQDKQARDDQERIEALRAAEVENRRIRQQASSQAHNQYHSNSPNTARRGYEDDDSTAQSKSQADRKARGSMEELTAKLHQARGVGGPRYEDANGRDSGSNGRRGRQDDNSGEIIDYDSDDSENDEEASIDFGAEEDEGDETEEQEDMIKREEELQAELNLATKRCQELKETLQVTKSFLGKGPQLGIKPNEGTKIADVIQSDEEETDSDDSDVPEEYDEDEENAWERPRSSCSSASGTPRDSGNQEAAREKAVQMLLQPQQEYKRSESGAGDDLRVGTRVDARYKGGAKFYPGKISRVRLDGTFDIEYDDGECESRIGKVMLRLQETRKVVASGPGGAAYKRAESESYETPRETPRMQRPMPLAVKQSSFKNLVDAPSPRGRLGDRITRLKQRCMQALGKEAFEEAYAYLKAHASNDDDGDVMDDEMDNQKAQRVRDILGHDKAHYMPLIDQLIFMEDTHSG